MSEWKGLDPGGTEQLWDPDVLVTVLQIFKSNEPFSRNDKSSSLYLDLEDSFPEITWRGNDADGTFRSIFRKTNPWVRLGLIGPATVNEVVTPLGEELLAGETSISTVFIEALKDYAEPDGTKSFSIMCSAALERPAEVFNLNDVEFAVSKDFAAGVSSLSDALYSCRNNRLAFPRSSRRPRTLRSFMSALVSAGALRGSFGGWSLSDAEIAKEIASYSSLSGASENQILTAGYYQPVAGEATLTYNNLREILPGQRRVPIFDTNSTAVYDPIRRALLLERANSTHESLVEECASIVRALGFRPIEDINSFDLAIVEKKLMAEMKSINAINCVSQIRKAIAQLPEYRWRNKSKFEGRVYLVIVLDQNPLSFVDIDYINFVELDRGIKIFWRSLNGLVGIDGQNFSDFVSGLPSV